MATNSKALVQAPDKNAHSANGQGHQCSEGEKRTVSEVVNEQAADRGRDQLRGGTCHREQADVAAGELARRQPLSDDREIDRREYAVGRPLSTAKISIAVQVALKLGAKNAAAVRPA